MQLARDIGRGRRVIDEDRALGHAREGALGPERHGAQVIVVADAGEHEFLPRAASAGVLAALPPFSLTHFSAFAKVRL